MNPGRASPETSAEQALSAADDVRLHTGLQRLLISMFVALLLLVAGTAFVILQLNEQVAWVNAVRALEGPRDQLLAKVREQSGGTETDNAAATLNAMSVLSSKLDKLRDLDPGNASLSAIAEALAAGRGYYSQVQTAGLAAEEHVARLRDGVHALYSWSGDWSKIVNEEVQDASAYALHAEDMQQGLNNLLSRLSAATLSAARIQREIDAVARYNLSDAGRRTPLNKATVFSDGIPPPCTASEPEATSKICNPSSARVHAALSELRASSPDELMAAIRKTHWALEAYVRAGELRFRQLTRDLDIALELGRVEGERLRWADGIRGRLSRLNRVFTELDEMTSGSVVGRRADVEVRDRKLRGLLEQARFRSKGTVTAIPKARTGTDEIDAAVNAMFASHAASHLALADHRRALDSLDNALLVLDRKIRELLVQTERSAEFWTNAISTAATAAITLLTLGGVLMVWVGHRLVARPIGQVTSTILAIAGGKDVGPVHLSGKSFGLVRVEQALERLRLANIEREVLTQKTLEQSVEIERSLDRLAAATREMEQQAKHDALTGLPNRRFADEFVAGLHEMSADPTHIAGTDFALLHIDIDRFKEINDTLGHDAGDTVLCELALTLADLACDRDWTFRIGGDEFLIIRMGQVCEDEVAAFAKAIIDAVNRPIDYKGHDCRVGASIGIAYGRDALFDGRETLINADIALYEAKKLGRNRYVSFSPPLQERTQQRKRMADRLILAVENKEFIPYYQPQFYADTMGLRGLEILCRWEHPIHGVLPPAVFLEQAQENNLLGSIDKMLLRRVSADLQRFRLAGHHIPQISFNVTIESLLRSDFAEELEREVGDGTRVAVELLESMYLDSLSEALRWTLKSLKDRGIGLEIDDFGSARASLAGLLAVRPDAMKIDGGIIEPMTRSVQHHQLVKAIIDIGNALEIDVIAEGVETAQHVQALRQLRCKTLQGFALGHPMAAPELSRFLSAMARQIA